MYAFNSNVEAVTASPVTEAQRWLLGRQFDARRPLLDVAQAVPDYPPAAELTAHLASAVTANASAFYTPIFGLPALRRALAEHMNSAYSAAISVDQVAIVAGCNQGFCAAVSALAGPGDEILLPLPYYFNHQMWVEMIGARAVSLPFNEAGGAVPDPVAASALITDRTRAIALVSPNNPTGAEYPAPILRAFYDLARERGIALLLDETYKDFSANSHAQPAHELFQQPDWQHTLVQLYSFSKSFSLTGYRVGSVIGAEELLHQIGKFQDCVAICAPHIGQLAALYGLRHLDAWRADKQRLINQRAAALKAVFQQPELRYKTVSVGAFFAYVKHPFRGRSATAVAKRLLDQQHILCLPGTTFGPGQDDYLRLAFANLTPDQITLLGERLIASQDD